MKYLLKWMNNCEKELLSSCDPLYNYAQWVRNSASEIASLLQQGFDSGELELPDLVLGWDDSQKAEYVTTLVYRSLDEYLRTYIPPSILTLDSPRKGGPDLLKSSTSLKDTIEVLHTLIANVVAFPHTLNEIIQETSTVVTCSIGHVDNREEVHDKIMAYIEPYLIDVLGQTMSEAPAALTNTKWGLKALVTYFFMKHSHKIQLTEVVQKMFEMTDISDTVDISNNLKLPYPMNYIEFNKSMPITMSNGRRYEVTGALMYEVQVLDDEDLNDGVHIATIDNFPKEDYLFIGTIHGMIGLDQVNRTKDDGYKKLRIEYDKAMFPLLIHKGQYLTEDNKILPDNVVFGHDKNKLDDMARTYLMGIPREDLPLVTDDTDYVNATINRLLSHNWDPMLTVGYGKLSFQTQDIMPKIAQLGVIAANEIVNMVVDPLFKYDKEVVAHNIKPETYTVVELVINYDKYSDEDKALWSNIGPYIEIGRREDGDLWGTVKEAFKDTLCGENANMKGNKTQFLEAFKTALQSIWFINEPNVKLKEAPEEQPSNRRQYYPKTKVTNKRKIVLRGEINRYLKSLSKTLRSSPKGAWWVRGHWRNQWYPSIQDNKRKWIRPYVKGTGKAIKKQVDLDPNTEV